MTKPDGERIAVVETKVDDLTKKIDDVASDVKTIMALLSDKYVTKADAEIQILELKKEIKMANNWRWVTHTASAVVGAILVILITSFLSHV